MHLPPSSRGQRASASERQNSSALTWLWARRSRRAVSTARPMTSSAFRCQGDVHLLGDVDRLDHGQLDGRPAAPEVVAPAHFQDLPASSSMRACSAS